MLLLVMLLMYMMMWDHVSGSPDIMRRNRHRSFHEVPSSYLAAQDFHATDDYLLRNALAVDAHSICSCIKTCWLL